MAIKVIITDGDPLLRQKSKEVVEITDRTIKLLDNMVETMRDAEGVGLAAIQISHPLRIAVVDVGDGLVELINPELVECKDEQTGLEGCLSVPGLYGRVTRSNTIIVKALNREGKETLINAEGFFARAILHEMDHMDGKLFTDLAEETYDAEMIQAEVAKERAEISTKNEPEESDEQQL